MLQFPCSSSSSSSPLVPTGVQAVYKSSPPIIIIIIAFGPYWSTGRLQKFSTHHHHHHHHHCLWSLLEYRPSTRVLHPSSSSSSSSLPLVPTGVQAVYKSSPPIIIIIIIIIAFGPYWSTGRLQEFSTHHHHHHHHHCLWSLLEYRPSTRVLHPSSSSSSLPLVPTGVQAVYKSSPPIIIIIIAFGRYWSTGRLQEFSRHPNPGPASQVVPSITRPVLAFRSRCQVFLGWPCFPFPCGFQIKA